MLISDQAARQVFKALNQFKIELPSWGFADTGTRFGKFHQSAAASTIEEKLHDAGLVHQLTGACPKVAVHVLWDFKPDQKPGEVKKLAKSFGVKIGSINPNLFQDQIYKFGSLCSPDKKARQQAMKHLEDCLEIAKAVNSKVISLWLADGTNYPGQDSMRRRKRALQQSLKNIHQKMLDIVGKSALLLVEYKPFEPAFYHTDIADWGMAHAFAKHAGNNAKVLVDTGHHLPGCNIEHLVSFLLDENMLGGFHFNDRKYADDDLTLGSIDPYAVFRIFSEIAQFEFETGKKPGSTNIEYMVDQSHNLKPKLEAMVQTVCAAQSLYARAHLVDRKALSKAQKNQDITAAECVLKDAFETDVAGLLADWREAQGLGTDPLEALRGSDIIEKLGKEREKARKERGETTESSYA